MILDKTPGRKKLKPGDPYTFIFDELVLIEGKEPQVGDIIGKWFATDEPGRNFRITAIHGKAIETVFEGFQQFEVSSK
jgi:hypothetical protein